MRALVLGATGFVGKALVRALSTDGVAVRAASRHPRADPNLVDVQWVTCDMRDPASVAAAVAGIDTVYYLVHSMGADSRDFRAIERQCAETLVHEASEAGCRRIIYLGGVQPQGEPSEHLASRMEVGQILRAGHVLAVELRASMIIGNGSASWQIMRDLAVRLPVMLLPRWLDSRSCPIALEDVVTALVDARDIPFVESAWFDLPGPDALRMREMLEIIAALEGRRLPTLRVPVLTPRISALWLKLVTRANYQLARELVLGLGHDLLPKDARYWEVTGHPPAYSFREAAARALANEGHVSLSARLLERLVHRVSPHVSQRAA